MPGRARFSGGLAALLAAALGLASTLPWTDPPRLAGPQPGDLVLKDIRYIPRRVDELCAGQKALVLVFTTTTCPVVQRYLPRLEGLSKQYAPLGVRFAAVNVGVEDSIQDVAYQAMQHGLSFPVFKDSDARAARAVGITRTPEVIVLDAAGAIRYRGRIDSQYRLSGVQPDPGRADLAEAIDDVLAGRAVRAPATAVDGCAVTFPPAAALPPEHVTYARDVAPILAQHCIECHRPGAEAPFSLLEYEDAAARAAMIAEVVSEGRMPPWFAHPAVGQFENQRRLSADERAQVVSWHRAGAPQGEPAKMPIAPRPAEAEWTIGEPDLVIQALWPEPIPAEGFLPYRYILLPHVFTHDTWVQGIEIMPGNRRVVHHANLGFLEIGESFDEGRNFITGRVPGGTAMNLKDGMAILIPAGSVIGLQIHYVTTGKAESDQISVGIRFAKEPVQKQLHYLRLADTRLRIPPGAANHEVKVAGRLPEDSTLLALFTHMHLRGKDTSFLAHAPDGSTQKLLVVPNYSFDWQLSYRFAPGAMSLPGDTRIECVSHFDNSSLNPFNPDPTALVRTGPQTHDEMMEAFVFYTIDRQALNLHVDPKTGRALPAPARE